MVTTVPPATSRSALFLRVWDSSSPEKRNKNVNATTANRRAILCDPNLRDPIIRDPGGKCREYCTRGVRLRC